MASHALKVDSSTVEKITEILEKDPTAEDALKNSISEAVVKVWNKTCAREAILLFEEECCLKVKPKAEYKKYLQDLTGKKGPYCAIKRCKSWVGISEGVYKLEECDLLIPVSCFQEPKKVAIPNPLMVYLLILLSFIQSSAMLLFIL